MDDEIRNLHSGAAKAGLPPGSIVFVGDRRVEKPTITIIDYHADGYAERVVQTAEECREYVDRVSVTWINVTGLHDTKLMESFGRVFGIHPLVLEDVLHTNQRPRFEDLGESLFVVLRMLHRAAPEGPILAEQVSLLLGKGYLLTFQEIEGDVFGLIRDRIRTGKGRLRKLGVDYLAYTLIDAIVDYYFVVLEEIGVRIETLQEEVVESGKPEILQHLHALRREMIFLRKNLWPLRELVSGLEKSESDLIGDALTPYLRDVYGHTVQVIDTIESLRDMLTGALDVYMSSMSNRMNEVMKVLTVITTIFMPMTFLAGVYGMNFEHMPELAWPHGYLLAWCFMLALGGAMAWGFRRKGWW